MGKKCRKNKKNKSQKNQAETKPSKDQQNWPQQSQSSKSQRNAKNSKQAPSPKIQAEKEYASYQPSKKRMQNQFLFEQIQEPLPNKGLTNLGNSCFANALFQCLYHVTAFRDPIIESKGTSAPLLNSLAHFFREMNQGSPKVQKAYIELLNVLFTKRPEFKINTRGDSSILLRALLEELAKEDGAKTASYLEIFNAGELTKSMTCPQQDCLMDKEIKESIKILEVRDINFNTPNVVNFFQSPEILRKCSCSEEKQMFRCEYTVTDLPKVLIIRIYDILGSEEAVKILPHFTLKHDPPSDQPTYEFVAAVLNQQKGEQGEHSVELSLHNNAYFIFDDSKVYSTDLNSINLHPKVIFYKKRRKDEPLIDKLI